MDQTTGPPDLPEIPLLQRRRIEAEIVGPLIRAFIDEFGRDPTLEVVSRVVESLAHQAGANLADRLGGRDLAAFAGALDVWTRGGALEITIHEQSAQRLEFDVTRCRYAELYRSLGLEDLGSTLSCLRDAKFAEGFGPDIELERTQTLMQGGTRCDFRFRTATDRSDSASQE
ncbi:MAG: L-2-amino-thiazoline-4-carboxylic acid hydrolase [Isosphaeraceae bacterium]|nr:L-2-amino-thiazoline-4-carboxylic acid hydrolase [Isosphaeraceae bacterium]